MIPLRENYHIKKTGSNRPTSRVHARLRVLVHCRMLLVFSLMVLSSDASPLPTVTGYN